jgi:hypothetical protein
MGTLTVFFLSVMASASALAVAEMLAALPTCQLFFLVNVMLAFRLSSHHLVSWENNLQVEIA